MVLSGQLAGWLLADFIGDLGALIVRQMHAVGLSGRLEVFIALCLLLILWIPLAKWMRRVSEFFTPQAKHWNMFVHIGLTAITFLIVFAIKSYVQSLPLFSTMGDHGFTTANFVMVLIIGMLSIVGLYIFLQKYGEPDIDAPQGRLPFE